MIKDKIIEEIKKHQNPNLAQHYAKFFQTHKGGYGEGDLFYGLKVPEVRKIVKLFYNDISLDNIEDLIKNPYHEVRLCVLFIMVEKFKKASEQEKELLVGIYLNNLEYINNWDLVDSSASYILGEYWSDNDLNDLWKLARSRYLWSERVSILTTFGFIKKGSYKTTLELCEFFLNHRHDLIHKATGWMLREIGKRDLTQLLKFLDKYHKKMPRTMLRYSIEKLPQEQRKFYMAN